MAVLAMRCPPPPPPAFWSEGGKNKKGKNRMKNLKKLASVICLLSVLFSLAAVAVNLEEKNVTAV